MGVSEEVDFRNRQYSVDTEDGSLIPFYIWH